MPDLNPAWSRPQDEMADWFKLYRDSFQLCIDDLQSNTMLLQVPVFLQRNARGHFAL